MHRETLSRKFQVLAATISFLFVLVHHNYVFADVRVDLELADQLPPLAHADNKYHWQFSSETFNTDETGDLTYEIKGLPGWAHFDAEERRITGNPSLQGKKDAVNDVTVTARDSDSEVSSTFQLTTISAPPPKLSVPLQEQLPQAASMGSGNMLANKVLHMPLGWSFSIGFLGDTYLLPDNDRVYYSSRLVGGKPLPDWLRFSPDEITFSGIAPTEAGKNGTLFDIELIASNRKNAGGPSSTFSLLLGQGFVTLNNTAAALPLGNLTEGEAFQYHISPNLFLLDGFSQSPQDFRFKLDAHAPKWLRLDQDSHNLIGKAPALKDHTQAQQTSFQLHVSHPKAFDTDVNVTLDVFPSPFKQQVLPNVTVQTGKDFQISLEKYMNDPKSGVNVTFESSMLRRSMHFYRSQLRHKLLRRASPSWIHYDEKSYSLVGQAPDQEKNVTVHVSATSPVKDAPVSPVSKTFQLSVLNTTHVTPTEPGQHHSGLSGGEKGAIAGSILGAALLALLGASGYWAWKRSENKELDLKTPASTLGNDTSMFEMPSANEAHLSSQPTNLAGLGADAHMPNVPEAASMSGVAGGGMATSATAGVAGVGAAPFHSPYSTETAHILPTEQPYASTQEPEVASSRQDSSPASGHRGVTQELPYQEPEWQREDDPIIVTPFLAQSTWQPPSFTQIWATSSKEQRNMDSFAYPEEETSPSPGPIRQPSMSSMPRGPTSTTLRTGRCGASHISMQPPRDASLSQALIQYKSTSNNAPLVEKKDSVDTARSGSSPPAFPSPARNASFGSDPDTHTNLKPMDIPASISKQSQESWEENLWYDKPTPPSKRTSAASARTQGSQVPDKEVGAGDVFTGPSEPLKTAERAHTIKRAKSTTSSTTSPTMSPPLDSSAWESAPQLAPIATSVVRSPIVPGLGDPPQLSVPLRVGQMSPLDTFSELPTQPMQVRETKHVLSYTPHLEAGAFDRRSLTLEPEQLESAGIYDDADEPVLDPFADHDQYPDGTILFQGRPSTSPVAETESTDHLHDYLTTEGGMYSIMEDDESAVDEGAAETIADWSHPPRSSTLASLRMARARSVTFTPTKPPRLQLASCRPGQLVSLPLLTSDASFPRHLADAIHEASSPAQYTVQLHAPTRPDLHGTWPSWLKWLEWQTASQELTGTVPESWPSELRLPLQLPIHILLSNGTQILAESGVSRRNMPEPGSPFLVARILLTILPAAEANSPRPVS